MHFSKEKSNINHLQQYFIAKEKIKAANKLEGFLENTNEGLSVIIGQHALFQAAKDGTLAKPKFEDDLKALEKELPDEDDLYEMAKGESVKVASERLQADIKLPYNAIRQRTDAITFLAGTTY